MSKTTRTEKKPIEQYDHKGKERCNNPPVGLVTTETDREGAKKTYAYDPHLDPQLQWAGKTEHTSFEIPTVSLHVHERIDPRTIIDAVRKRSGIERQKSLFEFTEENPPLREAIEFYKHKHNWSNRMISGDSLLVMNSLLEKEGMSGKVQMIYIDPPYGIKYGSNFQPFVNKRDVKDGKDEDLTQEPEMIKAFRDTWELGIHSYLTYLRDRLLLAWELLTESGSVFVQISDENVPHITLKSIANNEPPGQETLYDQPFIENGKARVSGPFTVEAVPASVVKPLSEIKAQAQPADVSVARSGETLRQSEWRTELLKCGIRGKNGQYIQFSRVEPLAGARWLHADAETKPNDLGAASVKEGAAAYLQRAVISFGPEHAPLERRQVELAWEEARKLVPRPAMVIFVSFQFDPEAAKDIDETDPQKVGMTFLKVQMNTDLLTDDLKKKRASNESFWLIGQPDVKLEVVKDAKGRDRYRVEVLGFDYYNTKTGEIESGGTEKIALWMLDTDYDGRSLFPQQVFFPMAGEKDGWARLAKNLKAEIDEELIEAYRRTVSLPFEAGRNKRIAVKIVDDRGIESLKIVEVK